MKQFLEFAYSGAFVRKIASNLQTHDQVVFLLDDIDNPPFTTTSSLLLSTNAFNIEEYVHLSEDIVRRAHTARCNRQAKKPAYLSRKDYECLLAFYRKAYGDRLQLADHLIPRADAITVRSEVRKFPTLQLHGYVYRSVEAQSARGSYIQALFEDSVDASVSSFPGQIRYSFEHDLVVDGKKKTHAFAFVQWYEAYKGNQSFEKGGLKIWKDSFLPIDGSCILPMQRIFSPVAVAKYKSRRLVIVIL